MSTDDSRPSQRPAVARPAEVWEPSDSACARIFAEIPKAFGAPGVHELWRVLASFPALFQAIWPAASADLHSATLEAAARSLVRASFIVEAVGLPSHKAFRGDLVRVEIDAELRGRIERFNDLSQMALSRLLLIAVALREGAYGRVGELRLEPAATIAGQRSAAVYVPPLRDGEAIGKADMVLRRIEAEHQLPFLDDYYLSLARLPEYLGAAWNAIRPIVGDPVYLERGEALLQIATKTASGLSACAAAAEAWPSLDPKERSTVRDALNDLAATVLPQTLIDTTLIKALTSGPDLATVSGQ